MTNLNLRKQKIKRSLIANLLILAILLAVLPLVIYLFVESLGKAHPYYKSGSVIIMWIACFSLCVINLVRSLSIYIKFRKLTFPTEEVSEVTCQKISLHGTVFMRFMKIETNMGEFIYIPTKDLEFSSKELRERYQRKWLCLKCYADTKLVKEIKVQD